MLITKPQDLSKIGFPTFVRGIQHGVLVHLGQEMDCVDASEMCPGLQEEEEGGMIAGYSSSEADDEDEVRLVVLLKACIRRKDLHNGSRLHADILKRGLLETNIFVGSAVVNMYAKYDVLGMAQQVLDELPERNVVSWNALIAGYTQNGYGEQALLCFQKMLHDGISPSEVTFTCVLKACGSIGAAVKGKQVHAEIERKGLLGNDVVLGNALMDMYAKCDALAKARQVFDELPVRNVVTWNVLIAGYCQHGHGDEAIHCFEQMKDEGLSPDAITYACILKASSSIGAIERGQKLHDEISAKGLFEKNSVLRTALLDMYSKCGVCMKAQIVFDELPFRDVVSWTALIAGYSHRGHGDEALKCFERMQSEGCCPDVGTFACLLKACGNITAMDKGIKVHAQISQGELAGKSCVLGSALVDMYSRWGALARARQVFDKLPVQDVASWTALMAGYCERGHGEEAIDCFEEMVHEGLSPDGVCFSWILKTCSTMGAADKGQAYFDTMRSRYGIIPNMEHYTAMVDLYGSTGAFDKVMGIIEEMPTWDYLPAWLALLNACQKWGNVKLGRLAFDNAILLEGRSLMAYVCMSNICAAAGMQQESEVKLAKAQQLLDEIPARGIVSWNMLIAGYCQNGRGEKAFTCFERMQEEDISPNAVTMALMLKACATLGAHEKGRHIHSHISREGLLAKATMLGNALVDMYAKSGALVKARQVFDALPDQDLVSWNVLIGGYGHHGDAFEALDCYVHMRNKDFSPDGVTFACILKACAHAGAAAEGREVHLEIVRKGLLDTDIVLGNALVDMYAKCGLPWTARGVFDELPLRNVVSWNTLITGYCLHALDKEAFTCFDCMRHEGSLPNAVTFACMLRLCGSMGALKKGDNVHTEIFSEGLLGEPGVLGHALIDMYAKCGVLSLAEQVFVTLPMWSVVSFNALMAGYCQLMCFEEVVNCFELMKGEGLCPEPETFAHILKACGSLGALEKGEEVHVEVVREGLLGKDVVLGSTLVHMYARCGSICRAQEAFDELPIRDVVSWTALITAYGYLGHVEEVLKCYERMKIEGVVPDAVVLTYISKDWDTEGEPQNGRMHLETKLWHWSLYNVQDWVSSSLSLGKS